MAEYKFVNGAKINRLCKWWKKKSYASYGVSSSTSLCKLVA